MTMISSHCLFPAQDESRGFSLEPANFPSSEDQGHRGFDLQPANQEPGMLSHDSDVRGTDSEARGYALSPVSEAQEFRGFNLQPASPALRGMDLQPASVSTSNPRKAMFFPEYSLFPFEIPGLYR